jgi:hypothetical protein
MRAADTLSSGLMEPRTIGHFPFFRQNNICMSPVLGSWYGATTEAAESLLAVLHSQGKLTTPRRKNRKIRHKIKIIKSK